MKGSIRFFGGLLIVMGAVGGIDAGTGSLIIGTIIAASGLAIMYSGTRAMNRD
jgi:hypothetical protein